MAEQNPAESFGDALQQFEQDGDVDAFVDGVFTEDADLLRPEVYQRREGRNGAREFWRAYRAQFDSVLLGAPGSPPRTPSVCSSGPATAACRAAAGSATAA
jgi:hypothetical protein